MSPAPPASPAPSRTTPAPAAAADAIAPKSTPPPHRRPGRVTILVPAKDEAEAIERTLRAVPAATLTHEGYTVDVVVLDGNSRDATARIARRLGATVVSDRANGKGNAVRDARATFRGDYVVMVDADGSYAADAIPRLLEPLAWGDADVVMGDRRPLAGAMTPIHKVGNVLLSLGASVLYGRRCPDLCTGLWAFRADVLRSLPLQSAGFDLEAELFALTARMHLRVAHVPVDYLPRAGTTKLSATRDGARIGWRLVHCRFRALAAPRRRPAGTRTTHRPPAGGGLGRTTTPTPQRRTDDPPARRRHGPP